MFWRIICLITNKLDNCLILIIVGFILIWRNTWLLYINVNNVGFYSSFISVLPFSLFSASPNVRFFIIVSALRGAGYDGWCAVEILPKPDPDTAAFRAAQALLPLFGEEGRGL